MFKSASSSSRAERGPRPGLRQFKQSLRAPPSCPWFFAVPSGHVVGKAKQCGLTSRSSGEPPACHLAREAQLVILHLAGQPPRRCLPLNSNVLREEMNRVIKCCLLLLLLSCANVRGSALIGTWQTGVIESEWGACRITATYHEDGEFEGTVYFIEGGGSEQLQGSYVVHGDTILRDIDGKTVEAQFEINGNSMRQVIGDEVYTFTRK